MSDREVAEKNRWEVKSESGPYTYIVTRKENNWRCGCPRWIHCCPRKDCKHIKKIRKQLLYEGWERHDWGNEQDIRKACASILERLKDFQKRTVEYVYRRLYTDSDATQRFLVADEVGLGKTLVARGIIAKAIENQLGKQRQLNVVYICSNAEIARQNINRLNVTGGNNFEWASRITMLPLHVSDLEKNRFNFVSFTPATSFELENSLGLATERALMYHMLKRAWVLKSKGSLVALQGHASRESFQNRVAEYDDAPIDEGLSKAFRKALLQRSAQDRREGREDIHRRFRKLCRQIENNGDRLPPDLEEERLSIVGELRLILAGTNLTELKPDLVILDEFQRFRHILQGGDEAARLARRLFEYSDENRKARVLLLSATPYKMLTLSDETGSNHYEDFLETLEKVLFNNDPTSMNKVRNLLDLYRSELFRLHGGRSESLEQIRKELEFLLRKVMVRTEKLSVMENRDGMLLSVSSSATKMQPDDVKAYAFYQKVARCLKYGDTIEFWKSAPYLLNFMEGYEFKKLFSKASGNPSLSQTLRNAKDNRLPILLSWKDISNYRKIDPANARLRGLSEGTVGKGAWKLLWLPPSLPYYRLTGPFVDPTLQSFTKRLIFSCWRVVPKVIAMMLSYEAESLMTLLGEKSTDYSPEARKRRGGLLRFGRSAGRLSGMPLFVLLYPSVTLACECDPLRMMSESKTVLAAVEKKIENLIEELGISELHSGSPDESWYWVVPFLLDMAREKESTEKWIGDEDLARLWSNQGDKELAEEGESSLWQEHLRRFRELASGSVKLGPKPKDLSLVLAQVALASPGVVSLRALARVSGGEKPLTDSVIRDNAFQLAWSFRNLFNLPESTSLIRGLNPEEPYWRRVLEYCVDGCLQAVLDEYVHMLREMCGLLNNPPGEVAETIGSVVQRALGVQSVSLRMDEVRLSRTGFTVNQDRRMRCRFAMRFGEERVDDEGKPARSDLVREAFNSPFWPFVLTTTSVGQEGLDFHTYCHAVVHWNLPHNPVDFEQREGRVHRFKGHAIRKNLARVYGHALSQIGEVDPWEEIFKMAVRDRKPGETDLKPFWIYPAEGGAVIERHVPAFPLSRDEEQLERLRRSLAIYRMVFGQPNQEDLIAYLLTHIPQSDLGLAINAARIDLSPPL